MTSKSDLVVEQSVRLQMLKITVALLIVIIAGVIFYHRVEGLSWVDAFYFTAMTLTTVGYGDITPVTNAGKIFTSIYAFLGIGIFFGFANALLHGVMNRELRFRRRLDD